MLEESKDTYQQLFESLKRANCLTSSKLGVGDIGVAKDGRFDVFIVRDGWPDPI